MKDVIAHVMTNYEDSVKQLSESRYCGQCFRGFERRHEMNIHPPPEVEEKPLPRFASPFSSRSYLTCVSQVNRRKCGASISPRNPISTPTTKRTTTTATPLVHIPHRLPQHFHFSTLPRSPAFNSHKNADGNVRPASRCVPVSARARNVYPHQQRPSTSPAHHPSTRLSTTETMTSRPRIPKTHSSNRSSPSISRPPLPPAPVPSPSPLLLPLPRPQPQPQPQRQLPARVGEDSCLCGRKNADVRRRTRMRWASSGSSPESRDVLPRSWRLELGRKARSASGYGLERPVWRRPRRPRCPRRHAQNQARRTATQGRLQLALDLCHAQFRFKCFVCIYLALPHQ